MYVLGGKYYMEIMYRDADKSTVKLKYCIFVNTVLNVSYVL